MELEQNTTVEQVKEEKKKNLYYIQQRARLTRSQYEFIEKYTEGMKRHDKVFFRQVLISQAYQRVWDTYASIEGIPIPRATFIRENCRDYQWEEVEHLMRRRPYSQVEHKCYRYRLHEELIEEFLCAGEEYLLSAARIAEETLYGVEGNELNKLCKPFKKGKKKKNPKWRGYVEPETPAEEEVTTWMPPTPINYGNAVRYLNEEKARIESGTLTPAQKTKAQARYLNNLHCFQAIVARATNFNYKTQFLEYSQELITPDEGLRSYEVGGGLQCASRDFKAALLYGCGVINLDAVKCHATIAHHEMRKLGIESGLEDLLAGKAEIFGSNLSKQTIKTAMLAVLNGAKLVNKLNPNFTLPRLVMEDSFGGRLSPAFQMIELKRLNKALTKQSSAIREWSKHLPKHPKIQKVSAFLQAKEAELLAALKDIACNDQHDGVLIRIEDAHKLNKISTGYLKIEPKPIHEGNPTAQPKNQPESGMTTRLLLAQLPPNPLTNTKQAEKPLKNTEMGSNFAFGAVLEATGC